MSTRAAIVTDNRHSSHPVRGQKISDLPDRCVFPSGHHVRGHHVADPPWPHVPHLQAELARARRGPPQARWPQLDRQPQHACLPAAPSGAASATFRPCCLPAAGRVPTSWRWSRAELPGTRRVFLANMTGNVVFVGFAWAGEGSLSATESLVALSALLVGAWSGPCLAAGSQPARATTGAVAW
jgi:hypothetical protein